MTRILACIDGSRYADHICANAAWAAKRLKAEIDLLHVLHPQSDYRAPADHTGAIGLGARSDLLAELSKLDEERSRLDRQKGEIILQHGQTVLKNAGIKKVNLIHRRGSLVETVQELEDNADIIFMGKRGEQADLESEFLGSNLEKVARVVHKPLFLSSSVMRPIKKFLIAYDGKENIQKSINYITSSPLLKGLECHVLAIEGKEGDIDCTHSIQQLEKSGFKVTLKKEIGNHPDRVISAYVAEHDIDLLVPGAYSHSRMRSIFPGSTTASIIKSCLVPVLLFR